MAFVSLANSLFAFLSSPPDPGNWRFYLGPLVTAVSIGVSATLALSVASRQLRTTRSVARMRATLDLIEKAESSDHYRRVTEIFSELRRKKAFMPLHDPSDETRPKRLALLAYLNHYETIALFIRREVLDEETYQAWIQGTLVNDWNSASEFIQRQRWDWDADAGRWIYDPSIYAQFQWLASRWNPDAAPLSESYSPHPTGLPTLQDQPLPEVTITPDLAPPAEKGPDSVDKPNR